MCAAIYKHITVGLMPVRSAVAMRALNFAVNTTHRSVTGLVAIIGLLLAGCAAQAPPFVREVPPDNPVLARVSVDLSAYVGRRLRWGGSIEQLENHAQETWLEIVERPLDDSGQPRLSDQSGGRFIAKISGFLDPVIYTRGRDITVTGSVEGDSSRKIGDFDYRFVVVKVAAAHLWPLLIPAPAMYYDPFWYDPWYPYWPRRHRHYYR